MSGKAALTAKTSIISDIAKSNLPPSQLFCKDEKQYKHLLFGKTPDFRICGNTRFSYIKLKGVFNEKLF